MLKLTDHLSFDKVPPHYEETIESEAEPGSVNNTDKNSAEATPTNKKSTAAEKKGTILPRQTTSKPSSMGFLTSMTDMSSRFYHAHHLHHPEAESFLVAYENRINKKNSSIAVVHIAQTGTDYAQTYGRGSGGRNNRGFWRPKWERRSIPK
ncbi:hypothetical protein PIB30_056121 [Stylosanthes scabra]|uniref:Uncharacterized protein n=1 Tax=Stylosanthes scabra TaxID=79078 RepID=A0ABU6QJN1_9FABA|nr:hypothetical protein [Stylosanthes scabra]